MFSYEQRIKAVKLFGAYVILALYTTSHGQSKGPKMVARGQCRRANG